MPPFLFYLILGYLLGSLSPGFFFGKFVKRVDLRKVGLKNTGASNTYIQVGLVYGVVTGAIDFSKAALVYFLTMKAGFDPNFSLLVGLTAVLGHIFPFYLKFHGGRGAASLWGLAFTSLFFADPKVSLSFFVFTLVFAFAIGKHLAPEHRGRKIMKLAALLLPLGLIWLPYFWVIWFVAMALILALVIDFLRVLAPSFNQAYLRFKFLSKEKEAKFLSGFTLFLTSTFLLFLFFPKEIAAFSLSCFILGDTFAPFGQYFLKVKLLREKTLGGALIVFLLTLIVGFVLRTLTPLSLSFQTIVLAAFSTTILDELSFLLDDNLLVPLGTATLLNFFRG